MFDHRFTHDATGGAPDMYYCAFYEADAWDVSEADWTHPGTAGMEITVGPKTGCRTPTWA